ncbi:MAG TPA: Ig-like domain-containing protein, partial [Terriglobales bacterium]|nr:Ig-like domain-containing protein [Terriglobales bacterium]
MKQVVWPLRAFSFLFALVVLLAATPAAQAQNLSPNLLTFTSTAVTNNSAAKPLTLTNSGNAAMSVSVSMIGGDFDQTNNCGTSLASKKSCTINVVFNPTGTGTRAAILEVRAGNGFQLALLAGSAIPQVTLSATSMTFASTVVGASSAAQSVSMKNNQNIAMPVTGVTITGDYTQTNNCGSSLAAGATCTLSVIFKPTAAGTRTGLLSVKDNAVSNPEDVTLTGTATAATVKSIAVTPATVSIVKGKTQQFTAVATYTNNTTGDVTATANWTSSSTAIATISKGLATGVAAGAANMTASVTGSTITGVGKLTVTAPALVSIAVSPNPVSVVKGKTQQFTATGTYSDGTTVALTAVTWSSTAGATITSSGLATASAVGAPVIKAASGTISGTSSMTVTPATLVSIAVTPATATIAKGKTQQFTATGTYSDNTTQNLTATAVWTSATGASVTGGLATGTAVGAPVITATSGAVSGKATLTVQAAALVSIAVTPSAATINKGLTQQFVAIGTYTDATTAAVAVTWTSTANATVATTGLATGTAVGSSTITATSGTIKGTAALTVNPAALVSISVTPATASIAKGLTQQYAATGTYTDATTQNLTATAVWTSAAGATVAPGGLATATAVGTPAITATSGAISGAAVMTVQPAALVSFTVAPSAASIARGTTQAFTAQGSYTDATVADITSTVTWSATSGATIAPTGIATATVIGSTTITASFNSLSSNAALSVIAPALTAITVTPGSASLGLHGQQQFSAMGTFADSTTQDLTNSVVWTSGNASLVSVSATGFAKVFGTSSNAIPVTASSSGITSNPAWLSAVAELPPFCSSPTIDMKLLVITNGKTEADFGAIKQTLDYLGTPYDVFDMTATPVLTPAMLSDGNCHGYYQGVIYTFGNWMYLLQGASDLMTYEQTYHVRQLNWFVYPGTDFGLNTYHDQVDSTSTHTANFTSASDTVFSYANTGTPLAFSNAFIYLSTPVGMDGTSLPSGASVTPLLTDSAGNALSVIYNPGDGREYLSQTFDSNQYLKHNLVLAYGLINWVTKGVFLGEYHIYAAGQVDDFFINDAEWVPGTPCSNSTTHDRTV